jgi:hypothetical protein
MMMHNDDDDDDDDDGATRLQTVACQIAFSR